MARLSKTGGKARARNASPARGRKTIKAAKAKAKRRIVPKSKPRRSRSISDLEAQLDLRTKQLVEALAQQTATAEILEVINSSPGDLAPVFEIILEKAHSLCDVTIGSLELIDGDFVRTGAQRGGNDRWQRWLSQGFRIPDAFAPAYRSLRPSHVADMRKIAKQFPDESLPRAAAEIGGLRTVLALPLVSNGKVFGRIVAARDEVRPFTDKQIALLQGFADQAVTAIQNARLFNQTKEALERQVATSEILRVISQSPTDVQPVFDAIVQTAVRLIRCDIAFVLRCDGATYSPAAAAGPDGPLPDLGPSHLPIDPGANFPSRAIVEKKNVHLPDWSLIDVPEHERKIQALIGVNSALYLPLLRETECIGVLALADKQANIFGESEIALAESFRDQALIAIENVRLFNETREALERQTATADILKVISSSVADTTPVFERILDSCERLAAFNRMAIFLLGEDGQVHIGAYRGGEGDALKATFPQPLASTPMFIAFECQQAVFFGDVLNNPDAPASLRIAASRVGSFSVLVAPLLWEGRGIGAFHVARDADATFSDREVALLKTFADQAAIAIQNARLFNESKEALERQTATSEVLQVISSSVSDTAPVFEKILDSCKKLITCTDLAVLTIESDNLVHLGSTRGPYGLQVAKNFRPSPIDKTIIARAVAELRTIHVRDGLHGKDVPDVVRRMCEKVGNMSCLIAPMKWRGSGVGALFVARVFGTSFTDSEIALFESFADQAVIAIQNARLSTGDYASPAQSDIERILCHDQTQSGSRRLFRADARRRDEESRRQG